MGRRAVLVGATCGFAAAAISGGFASAVLASVPVGPVLSFHRDEPWLDQTGTALQWVPPCGCRGGMTSTSVTDESLRRLNCYL